MDFDYFLQILEGHFYIPRKQRFFDLRESGEIPQHLRFVPGIVSGGVTEPKEILTKRQEDRNKYVEDLVVSKYLLTSCWTIDNGEDYLMWKGYTNKIGVCICTTIGQLIAAINWGEGDYITVCSNMKYERIFTHDDFGESMFNKEPYYKSENEVRFYVVHGGRYSNEELWDMQNKDIGEFLLNAAKMEESLYKKDPINIAMYKIFTIKPTFINSIILSPMILRASIEPFKKLLMGKYSVIFKKENMIQCSKISINS